MTAKNTVFYPKKFLNIGGKLADLSTPWVMGILNVTPDSFFDGGRYTQADAMLQQLDKMVAEGADIIDVGGMSTRPGAAVVPASEERKRVVPVVEQIVKRYPDIPVSVDTVWAEVAIAAVEAGAGMINDISAGSMDSSLFQTLTKLNVPYVLMHMQGSPQTMQQHPQYNNVVTEVLDFLHQKLSMLRQMGVKDVVVDPGFGFGKTVEHNYALLKNLQAFQMLEAPLLAGLSRKSMVNKVLGVKPEDALNGTTVLNTMALLNGAAILRVHDVKEAKEAVKLVEAYKKS